MQINQKVFQQQITRKNEPRGQKTVQKVYLFASFSQKLF